MADNLKAMLEVAARRRAELDAAEIARKDKAHSDLVASGIALRDRVMPRLMAASEAWQGTARCEISDMSDKVDLKSDTNRQQPYIGFSVTVKSYIAYSFVTHSPGYVSITEGSHGRGQNAYEFKVSRIDELTDNTLDLILESMLNKAFDLKLR